MKVLLIDGYNLFHRARFGFAEGEYSTVYTFFRGLRSLIEAMSPDKVIIALEGHPKFRHDLYPEYKQQRKISESDTQKFDDYQDFKRQKALIIDLLSYLPVELVYHPDYEGDDLIGTLVNTTYKDEKCIIASGDTDFIQLLDSAKRVSIYNPIKKEWVSKPKYDYVLWKSIVGDTADNIKGVHRVGHKTVQKVLDMSPDDFTSWTKASPDRLPTIERNKKLIKFAEVPLDGVISLSKESNFDKVKDSFDVMKFASITNDKSWKKFVETFPQ